MRRGRIGDIVCGYANQAQPVPSTSATLLHRRHSNLRPVLKVFDAIEKLRHKIGIISQSRGVGRIFMRSNSCFPASCRLLLVVLISSVAGSARAQHAPGGGATTSDAVSGSSTSTTRSSHRISKP